MTGERAVVRVSAAGAWQRLILQRGTYLSHRGAELVRSTLPVDIAFQVMGQERGVQKVRGTLHAEATTEISVRAPVRPHSVHVNGVNVKSGYDETTDMVNFRVGSGTSVVEWD
jgi:hypothetical protein